MTSSTPEARPSAREINETIRYTMWSVFAADRIEGPREPMVAEVEKLLRALAGKDLVIRGWYDVAGLRADADLMVWWHAPDARRPSRRPTTGCGAPRSAARLHPGLVAAWRCTGRPSSTRATCRRSWRGRSRGRTCASTRSCAPTSGTCCPRRSAARCSPSTAGWPAATRTCAPTPCPSFALGDYEWMLAFEADELHRIVDLMRDLRAAEARRHVREEIPFYTGPAASARRAVASLC